MFKFFVTTRQGNCFVLSKEVRHHVKVARIKDQKVICVYKNQFYMCRVQGATAEIIKKVQGHHELKGHVVLAASIIERKHFDWLIQKATELGVKTIIPVLSQNVAVKINDFEKKLKRWQTIAKHAAQQAFRNIIPKVSLPLKFQEVINLNIKHKFLAHEQAHEQVATWLPSDAIFLIGPEGGFTSAEVAAAMGKHFQVVNLGARILRAETAALLMLARIRE